jgi:hypothetical protein
MRKHRKGYEKCSAKKSQLLVSSAYRILPYLMPGYRVTRNWATHLHSWYVLLRIRANAPCFKFANRNDTLNRLHNDLCIAHAHMAEALQVPRFTEFPFEMNFGYRFRDVIDSDCKSGRNPVSCAVHVTRANSSKLASLTTRVTGPACPPEALSPRPGTMATIPGRITSPNPTNQTASPGQISSRSSEPSSQNSS